MVLEKSEKNILGYSYVRSRVEFHLNHIMMLEIPRGFSLFHKEEYSKYVDMLTYISLNRILVSDKSKYDENPFRTINEICKETVMEYPFLQDYLYHALPYKLASVRRSFDSCDEMKRFFSDAKFENLDDLANFVYYPGCGEDRSFENINDHFNVYFYDCLKNEGKEAFMNKLREIVVLCSGIISPPLIDDERDASSGEVMMSLKRTGFEPDYFTKDEVALLTDTYNEHFSPALLLEYEDSEEDYE